MRRRKKPTIVSEANEILREENRKLRKQLQVEIAELERVSGELNRYQATAGMLAVYEAAEAQLVRGLLECVFAMARELPKNIRGRAVRGWVRKRLNELGVSKTPRQLGRGRRKA